MHILLKKYTLFKTDRHKYSDPLIINILENILLYTKYNKKKSLRKMRSDSFGEPSGIRTPGTLIKSEGLLEQFSA